MKHRTGAGRALTRRRFLKTAAGAGLGLAALGCSSSGGQRRGVVDAWGWNIAAASLEEVVPMFRKANPGVDVSVVDTGRNDLYDRATTGFAAGGVGLPDVLILESDRLSGYVQVFPQGIANLSGLGAERLRDRIASNKWPQAILNGDIYAIPWDVGPAGVFYRTDFFDEAGVDVGDIGTWDDFIAAGEEVRGATNKQLLSVDMAADDGIFRMMLNQRGVYYFDAEGRVTLNSPEAVEAMETVKKIKDAGLMLNAPGYDGGVTALKNERIAAVAAGVWYSGTITSQAPEQKGNWDAFLLPAPETGGNRAANLGGSNLVLNASTEDLEDAYAYAEFAMTDYDAQMYMMENYGLFPSLLETYKDPFFDKKVPFFNDKPIYRIFADEVEKIPNTYFTDDYARAFDRSIDAQAQVLLNDGDPEQALTAAAEQLADDTSREIA